MQSGIIDLIINTRSMDMIVRNVMTKTPEIFSPDMTLEQAAKKMLERDIGFLPIGENDRLIGAITDRDIVVRAVAKNLPAGTSVRDIMTDEIRYCFETDAIDKAGQMMSDLQIRRLVVLNEDKRIVGIIALGDVATKGHDTMLTGQVTESVSEKV